MRKKCRSAHEDLERAEVGRTSGAATEGLSVQTRGTQKQIEALTAGLQKVTAQLAAASFWITKGEQSVARIVQS